MAGQDVVDRCDLDARPGSVGQARHVLRHLLRRAGRDDLQDAGQLIVSELVTNALLHAGAPVTLAVRVDTDGLLIEVGDGSPRLPAEREYATLAGTGRGLAVVNQLATGWGARLAISGKVVWARVTEAWDRPVRDLAAADAHAVESDDTVADPDEQRGEPPAGTVLVRLLNVPLLMHLAWHQHAEGLMREYLLARLDVDEAAALEEHALASDAMALLHDQLPLPPLPGGAHRLEDVEEVLISLVEPAPTLASGWLQVPEQSVASFRVLDRVIEEALSLAEAEGTLAPPIQPELRELRRWICSEVAAQSHGARPTAWAPPASVAVPRPPAGTAMWDTGHADRARKALIAADDSNRIIAVSERALALLGYDDPDQLIGHRLLVLIPPRFHQAHLAGFTMYLTSGRRPLLDTDVTVPFLRRDGTEVPLQLRVELVSPVGDHRVFVAELSPPG